VVSIAVPPLRTVCFWSADTVWLLTVTPDETTGVAPAVAVDRATKPPPRISYSPKPVPTLGDWLEEVRIFGPGSGCGKCNINYGAQKYRHYDTRYTLILSSSWDIVF